MAYAVIIGSSAETQVSEFQAGTRKMLEVSKVVRCSHILATWFTVTPLKHVLREAIDGGQLLSADRWHPFRAPMFHSKMVVPCLHQNLLDALDRAVREERFPAADDWYASQIGEVVEVFSHAASRGEAVVSFIEPPHDEERAQGSRSQSAKLSEASYGKEETIIPDSTEA